MNSTRKLSTFAGVVFAPLLLTACQSGPARPSAEAAPPATPALCNRDAADALAGKDRVTDDEARKLTGASLVRQIAPGSPVTMDFRQERVTIETDASTGKIVRAFCG